MKPGNVVVKLSLRRLKTDWSCKEFASYQLLAPHTVWPRSDAVTASVHNSLWANLLLMAESCREMVNRISNQVVEDHLLAYCLYTPFGTCAPHPIKKPLKSISWFQYQNSYGKETLLWCLGVSFLLMYIGNDRPYYLSHPQMYAFVLNDMLYKVFT